MANVEAMKMNEPHKRLRGILPKVGIRPVIDGRQKGVRESLETQTLQMAKNTAKFLTENLRHSNGLPIECVIPERCIGGGAEAADTAEDRLGRRDPDPRLDGAGQRLRAEGRSAKGRAGG